MLFHFFIAMATFSLYVGLGYLASLLLHGAADPSRLKEGLDMSIAMGGLTTATFALVSWLQIRNLDRLWYYKFIVPRLLLFAPAGPALLPGFAGFSVSWVIGAFAFIILHTLAMERLLKYRQKLESGELP